MKIRISLFVLAALILTRPTVHSVAQENIPVGTWRLHLSFNELRNLALGADRVYAASGSAILVVNKFDGEITTISKLDGLSGGAITAIAYDKGRDMLMVAYENGLLDIVQSNTIKNFTNLQKTSAISGSRKINHILLHGAVAYMSTDFGVVAFDLDKKEVKETYRDLSETGENLKIVHAVALGDSLFLATEKGVLAGSLIGSNLLDFRSWKRYSQGDMNNPVESVTVFNARVHAAISSLGIYSLQNGAWQLENFLQGELFRGLSSQGKDLVVTTEKKVWLTNGTNLLEAGGSVISNPAGAIQDQDGTTWIADGASGLVSAKGEQTSTIKPNGPSSNVTLRIGFSGDRIVRSGGGFTSALAPLNMNAIADQFKNGQWSAVSTGLQKDITDQAIVNTTAYHSSFGFGVEKISDGVSQLFNETNSPLRGPNPSPSLILVPAIEASSDGLWVSNYGVPSSLHLLSGLSGWESFSLPYPQAQFPTDLVVDKLNQVWMPIDAGKGGGIIVFNRADNKSTYLTNVAGKGALPSLAVRSIANDREGQVWVGTDEGVVYFSNPSIIFNSVDAARPVFENRFLLRDESIRAIAIDGGNRKWLGTANGVWLFGPTGEQLIFNFTTENSPLPSNRITGIAVDPHSGEVFFATENGLASFRAAATQSSFQFENVKIFPNPVTASFSGQVAINGLYRDALVKITDLGGRLVWQTRANGGTATWNARQLNGSRVSTGMYFVFATSEDGSEKHVGKIAVIE